MSKPNLPPLPPEVDTVRALFRGQPDHFEAQDYYYTQDQMRAYAEEAVRQALAAQVFRSVADERRAFEAWARNEWGDSADSMLMCDNDGDYLYLNTEWCAWVRRAAKGRPETRDG